MSHRPSTSPLNWASSRYAYCLHRVRPQADTGMFLNLTKNLSPKLRDPRELKKRNEQSAKYYAYIRLLERQRQVPKTFTGEMYVTDANAHAQVARDVSDRLHRAMSIYQPAESRVRIRRNPANENYLLRKPVYTRDEISSILDKLEGDDNSNDGDNKEYNEQRKNDVMKRFRKSQLYHAASSVREAIDEYVRNKPRNSDVIHRPFSARSCAHSDVPGQISQDVRSGERKATKSDVTDTSNRLHDDTQNDNEDSGRVRRAKSAPPKRSNSRRVTEEERDQIIERLTWYDKRKWPPESPHGKRTNVYK